jgi:hypothetical protein
MRGKWYVGLNASRAIFKMAVEPTQEICPEFVAVIGPFRTKRGAQFMATYGANNPHCQTVADAERIAKKYQGEK